MPTRNVVLTDHQTEVIERLVASGRYQNASEVLREGLRLVEDREEQTKASLKVLREAARVGIADLEAGNYRSFDSPTDLRKHLSSLRDQTLKRPRELGMDCPGVRGGFSQRRSSSPAVAQAQRHTQSGCWTSAKVSMLLT